MAIALFGTYSGTIILPDNRLALQGLEMSTAIDLDEPIVHADDWDDEAEAFVFLLERPALVRGEMIEGCQQLLALVPKNPPLVPSIDPRVVRESAEFIRWRRQKNAHANGIGQAPTETLCLYLRGMINPG